MTPRRPRGSDGVKGVRRLIDTGRHVYTNWQSIVSKHPVDVRRDPYAWAHREIEYTAETCPATLDIMRHTCTYEFAPEIPPSAFRIMAKRMCR